MSQQILFPYHPVSGLRLNATVDFIPGAADSDIRMEGKTLVIEEGSETQVNWNGAESQTHWGLRYLTDDDANECLETEAIWRPEDVDSIEIETPGKATAVRSPNMLRDQIAELGSTAREAVLCFEEGNNLTEAIDTLKKLLDAMGLLEPEENVVSVEK